MASRAVFKLFFRAASGSQSLTAHKPIHGRVYTTSMRAARSLSTYKGKTLTLNTGQILPAIGLGTFQDPDQQEGSVYTALMNGYRHIDTAHKYVSRNKCGRDHDCSTLPATVPRNKLAKGLNEVVCRENRCF